MNIQHTWVNDEINPAEAINKYAEICDYASKNSGSYGTYIDLVERKVKKEIARISGNLLPNFFRYENEGLLVTFQESAAERSWIDICLNDTVKCDFVIIGSVPIELMTEKAMKMINAFNNYRKADNFYDMVGYRMMESLIISLYADDKYIEHIEFPDWK